jgi:hypothetical protein
MKILSFWFVFILMPVFVFADGFDDATQLERGNAIRQARLAQGIVSTTCTYNLTYRENSENKQAQLTLPPLDFYGNGFFAYDDDKSKNRLIGNFVTLGHVIACEKNKPKSSVTISGIPNKNIISIVLSHRSVGVLYMGKTYATDVKYESLSPDLAQLQVEIPKEFIQYSMPILIDTILFNLGTEVFILSKFPVHPPKRWLDKFYKGYVEMVYTTLIHVGAVSFSGQSGGPVVLWFPEDSIFKAIGLMQAVYLDNKTGVPTNTSRVVLFTEITLGFKH